MVAFALAALFFLAFCISAREDRRRFRNAVLFGLTFITLSFALLLQVERLPGWAAPVVVLLVFATPALGTLALGVFLVANGVTMVRKEGGRPANLLSMLAGLGIFGMIALLIAVGWFGSPLLGGLAGTLTLVVGYVSFIFLCFLGYAFLYGRIKVRGDVDHVVMLGSGLVGGDRVPPLLASRLRKGQEIYEAQLARGGRPPVLLTSGGKGSDEKVAEARAMADWLIAQGVPAEHIALEDRSTTTEENMRFSREIMAAQDPAYRCVVVTNNFHAFRAAMLARKAGVNGQVLGSPTAKYYWPSATIREFVAVFWEHKAVNLGICGLLIALGALGTLSAVAVTT
ncbi:YdcF family protein [Streptomyces sp. NBC_01408]|uniref:YdcF family protein n=1 Tax=Streptomyces sp. NBC_01408 TaxID=2903855 RepID=UPI00225B0F8E|nr:YdcF family protein [Streptomyces sp. NBC_01408]MCX4691315.1 YdcF family protein [Streptomyces sp. NBC_01408]